MELSEALREENRGCGDCGSSSLTPPVCIRIRTSPARALSSPTVEDAALTLFPGKETAFELIYRPRFERVLHARWPTTCPTSWGSRSCWGAREGRAMSPLRRGVTTIPQGSSRRRSVAMIANGGVFVLDILLRGWLG